MSQLGTACTSHLDQDWGVVQACAGGSREDLRFHGQTGDCLHKSPRPRLGGCAGSCWRQQRGLALPGGQPARQSAGPQQARAAGQAGGQLPEALLSALGRQPPEPARQVLQRQPAGACPFCLALVWFSYVCSPQMSHEGHLFGLLQYTCYQKRSSVRSGGSHQNLRCRSSNFQWQPAGA